MGMENQLSFAANEWQGKKKRTKRERFLERMDALVPWARLKALIEPHCRWPSIWESRTEDGALVVGGPKMAGFPSAFS